MYAASALAGEAVGASPEIPDAVLFACGEHRFGLPLGAVREVLAPRPLTRLPGCDAAVAGLVNLRGRVLTVFDLGALLALGPSCAYEDHRLLVVADGARVAAFAVERMLGVGRAAVDELVMDAAALRALDIDRADLIGIGTHGGAPFLLLDAAHLLQRLLS
ncbi:MAG TPA: chemotaxis protein CheW [Longimicrobiales bacterium]